MLAIGREMRQNRRQPLDHVALVGERHLVSNLRRDDVTWPAEVRHDRDRSQRESLEDDGSAKLAQRREDHDVSLSDPTQGVGNREPTGEGDGVLNP
jgi:hypothetical protein